MFFLMAENTAPGIVSEAGNYRAGEALFRRAAARKILAVRAFPAFDAQEQFTARFKQFPSISPYLVQDLPFYYRIGSSRFWNKAYIGKARET